MLRLGVIALVCLLPLTFGKKLSTEHCSNGIDTIVKTVFRKANKVTFTLNSDDLITLATAKTGQSTRKVHFSAYLTKHLENMKKGQVLLFDDVIVNRGGGYNPKNGSFVCPVSGDYWFSLDYLSMQGPYVRLLIEVNGKEFTRAHAEPGSKHVSVSRNVLIPLQKGSFVRVTNHEGAGKFYGHYRYTGFSGYLLSEI